MIVHHTQHALLYINSDPALKRQVILTLGSGGVLNLGMPGSCSHLSVLAATSIVDLPQTKISSSVKGATKCGRSHLPLADESSTKSGWARS